MVQLERMGNNDSRTLLQNLHVHFHSFEYIATNMFSDEFDLVFNYSFEESNLFTFEDENRTHWKMWHQSQIVQDLQLSPPKEFKRLSLILRQRVEGRTLTG